MKKFRGTDDVKADIDEMRREYEQQKKEPKWSFGQLLRSKKLRLPLVLVICLAVAQQLSGINIVSVTMVTALVLLYKYCKCYYNG